MRKVLLIALTALIIPQIAFAAWWNPFSWKVFQKSETKTQILENRVKELEQKLEKKVDVASSTKPISSSDNKPVKKEPVVPSAKKVETAPVAPKKEIKTA